MNITFSFTTRLTIIALLSFLIFFIVSLIVVYELGKNMPSKLLRKKIREYLWIRKNTQLDPSTEGKK